MIRTRQPNTQRSYCKVATSASLSVVVVAAGPADSRLRAMRVLANSCSSGAAQLIVVAPGAPDASLQSLLNRCGALFVSAPVGSTRAEMCDLGMRQVTGAIVALRDATDVGDASWLGAFSTLVPGLMAEPAALDVALAVGQERVVLDTMLPAGSPDDVPVPQSVYADLGRTPPASIEMAAIM